MSTNFFKKKGSVIWHFLLVYRGSTIYPQKANLFRLSRFYSQVILRASFEGFGYSFAFLAFLLFSLFSRLSPCLFAKRKRPHRTDFSALQGLVFSLFCYSLDERFLPFEANYLCLGIYLLYRGSTIYPQKAKLFSLSRFYSQVILRASFEGFGYSFAFLAFLLFSLFSRLSPCLFAKRKRPHRTDFSALQGLVFLLFCYSPDERFLPFEANYLCLGIWRIWPCTDIIPHPLSTVQGSFLCF